MAIVSCPRCGSPAPRGGVKVWVVLSCIVFFPLGLLALLAPREPTVCPSCHFIWQS
jgi:hypothetical protein